MIGWWLASANQLDNAKCDHLTTGLIIPIQIEEIYVNCDMSYIFADFDVASLSAENKRGPFGVTTEEPVEIREGQLSARTSAIV